MRLILLQVRLGLRKYTVIIQENPDTDKSTYPQSPEDKRGKQRFAH